MIEAAVKQRERRKFPRRDLQAPIQIQFQDGSTQQVILKDLSATGTRIVLHKNLEKYSFITVNLKIPDTKIDLTEQAQIAWTKNNEAGIFFSPNNRIASFILEKPNNINAFTYEHTVYLKDTNAFGNTYFANYFVWQGMAREAFLKFLLGDPTPLMTSGIKMITVRAHTEYYHETICYDEVVIKAHSENMKRCSFDLIFNFYNKKTSQLIAKGYQTIAFSNSNGYLTKTPPPLQDTLKEYEQK